MFSFYTIVTIIAIVLLVIALTIIGLSIKNNIRTNTFPDYQYTCPDFWKLDNDNKTCIAPSGVNNPQVKDLLANTLANQQPIPNKDSIKPDRQSMNGVILNQDNTIKSIDITSTTWPSTCSKVHWSKTNKILWDGIMQNNECA